MSAEIWDAAERFSDQIQKQSAISNLQKRIARIGARCSDCDKWMKSSICPREKNIKGRLHGPSSDDRICGDFVECSAATSSRFNLTAELAALTGKEAP